MTKEFKKVSIIVPCRNEEVFISKCLDSIIVQDYPKDKMEILVIDGMSEDKTTEIIKKYSKKCSFLKTLENPKKITPAAMNIGIKASEGEIIIKMDAHSTYQKDYVSKCVKYLEEWGADGVGGIIKTLPSNDTPSAKAIAFALSHPFGTGLSYFRIGAKKPKWVDTVAFGCYRKEIFERFGLYNDKAERVEDIELNSRIRRGGGKILLVPEIVAFYYPKSNFRDFFKHNISDGFWSTYSLKRKSRISSIRHFIPLIFVLCLMSSLIFSFISTFSTISTISLLIFLSLISPYLFLSILFSFKIVLKEKNIRYLFFGPLAFAIRHFGYGLGSIIGLMRLLEK